MFKFRPSSHSEDYTIIASYQTDEDAAKAQKAVDELLKDMEKQPENYDTDWSPDEAQVSTCGNQVSFAVYSAGSLDDVESALQKEAEPESLNCYTNYQELTIMVKVPKGLTPQSAILVLDTAEAEAIKWLTEHIGNPKITEEENEQTYEWFYAGDEIYYDTYLYAGFEFHVNEKENWVVEE
ncbi:MAG: hypothetical protein ACQCN4_02525 [Candidatus Bathyarchaeia archaeon]|jgi:hypothetical protein